MKKQFTLIVLALVALGNASFGQAALILHDKQINKFGSVLWESTSVDECVVTDVFVQAGETKQTINGGGKPFSSPFTYIQIAVIDFCSLEYLYFAEGVLWTGNGDVADNLTSANTDATISLFDEVSGTTSSAHIALNWSANSKMITGTLDNSHINIKGLHYAVKNNGVYRDADISGSITIDGGSNIINGDPDFCYIIRGGTSTIINIHPRKAQPGTSMTTGMNNNLVLYPNPATNVLHLNTMNASSYSVVDMVGAVITAKNVEGQLSEDVDLSTVVPGIYFLRMQTADGEVIKKFMKQ